MSNKRDDRHLELAKVSIVEVATIAAHLPPETPASDAVKRAYELLEWAAAAREGLDADEFMPSAVWGIYREQLHLEEEKKADELQAKALPRKRVDGVFQPHPFEAVTANLMGKVKKVDRLPRFKWWVMDGHQITNEEAADLIEEWRREGVPDKVYQSAWVTFYKWWEDTKRKRLSKQGKAPKKGKQGRVKSKTDKRTGARPDKEKFKKALGV